MKTVLMYSIICLFLLISTSIMAQAQAQAPGKGRLVCIWKSTIVNEKHNEHEIIAALVNMDTIEDEGCEQRISSIKIEGVQFGTSGSSIVDSFHFTDKNSIQWSIPTNINENLSKTDKGWASSFIKPNRTYLVHYQVCGSGGFASLISIYDYNPTLEMK